jgi:hypothetical protein
MAFRYLLEQNSPDSHQSDPWWFGVVVRFKHVTTFDRNYVVAQAAEREMNVSLQEADIGPVDEREPLVLTNQIVAFTVNHAKASHTASASFRVVPGQFAFESLTHAGDWLLFWAFDNYEDYQRVLTKALDCLQNKSALGANAFMDGLKFVGRLNAPKRRRSVDPNTGMPRKEYELTAVGFGEFDAKVYYNQAHHAKYQELIGGYVAQIHDVASNNSSRVDDVIKGGLPLTTAEHAQIWLETFLGAGPGAASKGFDPNLVAGAAFSSEVQNSLLQSPNDCFLVPTSVGRLLGIQSESNTLRYFDLLNVFIGVQGPSGGLEGDRNLAQEYSDVVYNGLVPYSIGEPSGTYRAQYLNFGMVTVWDLIAGFSNQPLNEMFVSLRTNASGKVGPTFMLRQNPMSSIPATEALQQRGWAMSAFTDVPRWVVSNTLVTSENLGPSDSLHFNYVHVQGQDPIGETAVQLATLNTVLSPPMADMADIKRSGLRPFVATLSSDITGQIESRGQLGRAYTQFMADILLDAHLKWSGTLQLQGVQEPIAIGDNAEYDGVVYHIESVTHSGHIDTNSGRKTFQTSLQLSNGISSATTKDNIMPYESQIHVEHTDYESRIGAKDATVNIDGLLQEQSERVQNEAQKLAENAAKQLAQSQLQGGGLNLPSSSSRLGR